MSREAVVVLGMHRGGTSAVAGLLVRLGAAAPATLMPADETNSEGYWESAVLCQFHDRMLAAAGTRWDAYTRLDPHWFPSPAAHALETECRGLVQAEFGGARRFVLKDPRMCRFVPFWLRVLGAEGIAAAVVLVVRNPYEVASSLEARNGLGESMSLLIWLRHMIDAECTTRHLRRTLVRYGDVLADWQGVVNDMSSDLGGWPTVPATGQTAIGESIKPRLRHHHQESGDSDQRPLLADWVQRTWAALGWLLSREPARTAEAHYALDAVREELDRTTSVFGNLVEPGELDAVRRINDLESQIDALRQGIQSCVAEREALRLNVAALETSRQELEAQGDVSRREASVLRAEMASARAELAQAVHEVQALRSSLSWRITAPLRAIARIAGYGRRSPIRR